MEKKQSDLYILSKHIHEKIHIKFYFEMFLAPMDPRSKRFQNQSFTINSEGFLKILRINYPFSYQFDSAL